MGGFDESYRQPSLKILSWAIEAGGLYDSAVQDRRSSICATGVVSLLKLTPAIAAFALTELILRDRRFINT